LLVTGSIGIDNVKTPHGEVKEVLGGSAVYFSFAASYFTKVALVGVVGEDFPAAFQDTLKSRGIDIAGLEARLGSKTFRWTGSYEGDMNEAQTLNVELNVLGEKGPTIPAQHTGSRFVFLANTHPALQRDLVGQLEKPEMIVCDTMNLWIETEREELIKTLGVVNGVVLNDGEARLLTEETNLITAGRRILAWGPKFVVIKKGEHGAMLILPDEVAVLPAYPTGEVRDPTGAGDSFAGGMMGYLATADGISNETIKRALACGTVTASFAIEGFSLDRVREVTRDQVDERLKHFAKMLRLD
jgi:sugar/nucleoside kinase (ribokinase family)